MNNKCPDNPITKKDLSFLIFTYRKDFLAFINARILFLKIDMLFCSATFSSGPLIAERKIFSARLIATELQS